MDHFCYRIGSYSNLLGRPPRLYHSRDLISEGCRFASVYGVRKEDAEAITQAGTAAGFKGIVWSRRLWIDFDNHEAADRAEAFLKEQGYDYVVYDTGGGRGKHIGVLRAATPSHVLPAQDRAWVGDNCPGADMGLYWHLHLLRLPGAIHSKTSLPKRLIARHPGRELVLPPWAPKEVELEQTVPVSESSQRPSIFRVWEVTSRLMPSAHEGDRHRHLVMLAAALKQEAGVTIDEALWVVQEVNRGFDEPKGHEEVLRIVRWAYGLGG